MLPAENILNVNSAEFNASANSCAWFMCGMCCCLMCLCEGTV